ncbi:hypothetical protein [Shewanella glacialimarina]|jgi:hypothetical protein|uniref:hypothetical protein n=1 Tax=Shewanella glacialimarina TaxID=2590884 RepID=UPI001CF87679|nr:hypothetical protein [Shewanella glacialimarina]UCX04566.1 hypothetical protein FJ709_08680 [Shewanella glacialimarina]
MSTSLHSLKSSFRSVYPEYAKLLDSAKSQAEIKKLQSQFLKEAQYNLAKALNKTPEQLLAADQTAPIALTQKQYENLINATGNVIEQQLHVILDGTSRLKSMEKDDPATVTAQIVISGLVALGGIAYKAAGTELVAGAVEAAAAYAGVEVATVGAVCAIAAIVIVAILIPIIYFMEKPANCIVLLINELDDELAFKSDANVHGKPMLMTTPIPQAVVIPGVRTVATAGFIATEKREDALVGTQYGFTFSYKNIDLTFGVECPLTGIYVDNNCYCGIGISPNDAAEKTDSTNKQSYTTSKDGITLSITCNSGSGSIAYYVARAYKTPA